jgi:hypothetical protein
LEHIFFNFTKILIKKNTMKKIYSFIALLLVSGVIYAQVQRSVGYTLSSINVLKEINTIPSSPTKAVIDSLHYDGVNTNAIGTGTSASSFGVMHFSLLRH